MPEQLGEEVEVGRQNISRQVASVLRDYVLTGRLKPGDRIVQADWATRLKVSRMPIRDAVNTLVLEGILVQSRTGAAVVAETDARDIRDGYVLNAIISRVAAARAAEVISDAELENLEEINRSIDAAVKKGNRGAASRLNWQFHSALNHASGSARLLALLSILAPSIPHSAFAMLDEWPTRAVRDHEQIIRALRRHDAEATGDLVQKHIEAGSAGMLKELERKLRPKSGSPDEAAAVDAKR